MFSKRFKRYIIMILLPALLTNSTHPFLKKARETARATTAGKIATTATQAVQQKVEDIREAAPVRTAIKTAAQATRQFIEEKISKLKGEEYTLDLGWPESKGEEPITNLSELEKKAKEKFKGSDLKNVSVLFLEGNKLKNIPANFFRSFPYLTQIYLRESQIETIDPQAFEGFTDQVDFLDLSRNNISTLPEGIFTCMAEHTTNLPFPGFISKPLEKFASSEVLLGYNPIAETDNTAGVTAIENLKKKYPHVIFSRRLPRFAMRIVLRTAARGGSKIKEEGVFGEVRERIKGLVKGDIGYKLTTEAQRPFLNLAHSIAENACKNGFTNLGNKLASFRPVEEVVLNLGNEDIKKLERIDTVAKELNYDPVNFKNVTIVILSANQLKTIPDGFLGKLFPNAIAIDLTDNDITTIGPRAFDGLPNLKFLFLAHNQQLHNMPASSIENCPKLQVISLYYTGIARVAKTYPIQATRARISKDSSVPEIKNLIALRNAPSTPFVLTTSTMSKKIALTVLSIGGMLILVVLAVISGGGAVFAALTSFPADIAIEILTNWGTALFGEPAIVKKFSDEMASIIAERKQTQGGVFKGGVGRRAKKFFRLSKTTVFSKLGLPFGQENILDLSNELMTSLNEIKTKAQELYYDVDEFKNVTVLRLPRNNITTIPANAFKDFPKVKAIDLTGNLINSIDPNAFVNLPELKYLLIGDNQIAKFPPEALNGCKNLKLLVTGKNPVAAGYNMFVAYARKNGIKKNDKEITPQEFESLKKDLQALLTKKGETTLKFKNISDPIVNRIKGFPEALKNRQAQKEKESKDLAIEAKKACGIPLSKEEEEFLRNETIGEANLASDAIDRDQEIPPAGFEEALPEDDYEETDIKDLLEESQKLTPEQAEETLTIVPVPEDATPTDGATSTNTIELDVQKTIEYAMNIVQLKEKVKQQSSGRVITVSLDRQRLVGFMKLFGIALGLGTILVLLVQFGPNILKKLKKVVGSSADDVADDAAMAGAKIGKSAVGPQDIPGLSIDDLVKVSPDNIRTLPADRFKLLTKTQLESLTDDQIKVISKTQLDSLKPDLQDIVIKRQSALTAAPAPTPTQPIETPPAQPVTPETPRVPTPEPTSRPKITPEQLIPATPEPIRPATVSVDDWARLTTPQQQSDLAKMVKSYNITDPNDPRIDELIAGLTKERPTLPPSFVQPTIPAPIPPKTTGIKLSAIDDILTLGPDDIAKLDPEQFSMLTTEVIQEMNPNLIQKITPEQFVKMQIDDIPVEKIQFIDPKALEALNKLPDEITLLTPDHIKGLSNTQVQALKNLDVLTEPQLQALNVNYLAPEQLRSLSNKKLGYLLPDDLAKLNSKQLQALTTDQLNALAESQIKKINLRNLNQNQILGLSNEQVKLLSQSQIDELSQFPDLQRALNTRRQGPLTKPFEIISKEAPLSSEQLTTLSPEQLNQVKNAIGAEKFNALTPSEQYRIAKLQLEGKTDEVTRALIEIDATNKAIGEGRLSQIIEQKDIVEELKKAEFVEIIEPETGKKLLVSRERIEAARPLTKQEEDLFKLLNPDQQLQYRYATPEIKNKITKQPENIDELTAYVVDRVQRDPKVPLIEQLKKDVLQEVDYEKTVIKFLKSKNVPDTTITRLKENPLELLSYVTKSNLSPTSSVDEVGVAYKKLIDMASKGEIEDDYLKRALETWFKTDTGKETWLAYAQGNEAVNKLKLSPVDEMTARAKLRELAGPGGPEPAGLETVEEITQLVSEQFKPTEAQKALINSLPDDQRAFFNQLEPETRETYLMNIETAATAQEKTEALKAIITRNMPSKTYSVDELKKMDIPDDLIKVYEGLPDKEKAALGAFGSDAEYIKSVLRDRNVEQRLLRLNLPDETENAIKELFNHQDRLAKRTQELKKLLDNGSISPEEYAKKMKEVDIFRKDMQNFASNLANQNPQTRSLLEHVGLARPNIKDLTPATMSEKSILEALSQATLDDWNKLDGIKKNEFAKALLSPDELASFNKRLPDGKILFQEPNNQLTYLKMKPHERKIYAELVQQATPPLKDPLAPAKKAFYATASEKERLTFAKLLPDEQIKYLELPQDLRIALPDELAPSTAQKLGINKASDWDIVKKGWNELTPDQQKAILANQNLKTPRERRIEILKQAELSEAFKGRSVAYTPEELAQLLPPELPLQPGIYKPAELTQSAAARLGIKDADDWAKLQPYWDKLHPEAQRELLVSELFDDPISRRDVIDYWTKLTPNERDKVSKIVQETTDARQKEALAEFFRTRETRFENFKIDANKWDAPLKTEWDTLTFNQQTEILNLDTEAKQIAAIKSKSLQNLQEASELRKALPSEPSITTKIDDAFLEKYKAGQLAPDEEIRFLKANIDAMPNAPDEELALLQQRINWLEDIKKINEITDDNGLEAFLATKGLYGDTLRLIDSNLNIKGKQFHQLSLEDKIDTLWQARPKYFKRDTAPIPELPIAQITPELPLVPGGVTPIAPQPPLVTPPVKGIPWIPGFPPIILLREKETPIPVEPVLPTPAPAPAPPAPVPPAPVPPTPIPPTPTPPTPIPPTPTPAPTPPTRAPGERKTGYAREIAAQRVAQPPQQEVTLPPAPAKVTPATIVPAQATPVTVTPATPVRASAPVTPAIQPTPVTTQPISITVPTTIVRTLAPTTPAQPTPVTIQPAAPIPTTQPIQRPPVVTATPTPVTTQPISIAVPTTIVRTPAQPTPVTIQPAAPIPTTQPIQRPPVVTTTPTPVTTQPVSAPMFSTTTLSTQPTVVPLLPPPPVPILPATQPEPERTAGERKTRSG